MKEHYNKCSAKSKIKILIHFQLLPSEIIQKIIDYGIQTDDCKHVYDINYIEEKINEYSDYADECSMLIEDNKFVLEKAKHIYEGTYDEWLDEDYY